MVKVETSNRYDWLNRPSPYAAPPIDVKSDRNKLARFINKRLKTGMDASLYFQERDRWYYMEVDKATILEELTEEEKHPKPGRRKKEK